MSGTCASMEAWRIFPIGCAGSVMGEAAWMRPPSTRLGMDDRPLCAAARKQRLRYSKRIPSRRHIMTARLGVTFTGLRFDNPFLLASAPPTESDSNIMRAFEAGWGGVVTKTIGLHPVVNVAGPKTKFLRAENGGTRLSMQKRNDTTLVASWNWELISDKPLDWWIGKLARIKKTYPSKMLVASIMAG